MNFKVSQLKSLGAGEVAVDDLIYVIDSNPTDGSVKSKKVSVGDLIDSRIYGISSSQFVLITGYYANPSWILSLDWSKIINAPSFVTSLSALTDVQIATPLSGQALVYNGTKWVNQGIGELDTLATVTTRGNTTTNSITVGGATVLGAVNSVFAHTPLTNYEGFGGVQFNVAGGSERAFLKLNPNSGEFRLGTTGSGYFTTFYTGATERMRIFYSTGNVSIGTNTDSGYKLDVNGDIRSQGVIRLINPAYINGGYIAHTANSTLVLGGGPLGGENITIGPSNRIFIFAQQSRFTGGSVQIASTLTLGNSGNASANSMLLMQGSITASSLIARGIGMDTTLVAAANNDVLVGLDINPTFTNGAFTGFKNLSIRVGNSYGPYSSVAYGHGVELNTSVAIRDSLDLGGDSSVLYFWKSGSRGNGGVIGVSYVSPNFSHLYFGATQTKQMILAATGNLLINTTTDAGYKLDVNGTARFTGNVSLGSPNVNDKLEVYGNILIRANDRIRLAGTSDGNTAIYAASAVNITANVRQNGFGTFDVTFGALGSQTRVFRVNDHTGHANVVIGVNAVSSASAVLQADSTTQGFLKPRLTSVEKNAITTPATGLEVYDSTTNTPNYYNGTTWVGVASNQSTGLSPGLFAQTSDSIPVANTTVETTLISAGVGTLSVPANQFQVGASYVAYLSGVISSQNNATLEIHLRSNGFVLADTDPMTLSATTGKFWELHVNFTVRAIGAGGVAAIVTSGRFSYNKDSGNIPESVGFSSINNTTFDTTINNTLTITATWGNASPLNSIYSRIFNLYRVY